MLDDHNTQVCNDTSMDVLKHCGILRNNIVLSINDMINAFVATGQLIVGTDSTYNMHLANLACDQKAEEDVQQGDC